MAGKRKKSVLWRLLLIGISIYMVVTLVGLWSTLDESRAQLSELEKQAAAKEVEIEELRELLSSGSQEQLIERAARERLGYVYADEQIFIDISGN